MSAPAPKPVKLKRPALRIGSEVEIARCVKQLLQAAHGQIIGAEGQLWFFDKRCWQPIPEHALHLLVQSFDGAAVNGGRPLKVSFGFVTGTLNCLAAMCEEPGFFDKPQLGICCENGFIDVSNNKLVAHAPEQQHRFALPGKWNPDQKPPQGKLLKALVENCFKDDPEAAEKQHVLRQVAGCVALAYNTHLTQPKGIILHGPSANNGKSQFLEVYKALVPKEAVCALSLARLGDDRYIPLLAGKLLNCSAETPSAAILSSDVLKAVITGEEISGREVRRRVVKFKPVATHVIASNRLPSFEGMDQGILRRFLIVEFLRTIPENERIPELGNSIAQVEQDALLAWAVEGAMDLLKSGGFVEPPSSQTALEGWFKDADPVAAFAEDCVVPRKPRQGESEEAAAKEGLTVQRAYEGYRFWAQGEGYDVRRLIVKREFSKRLSAILRRPAAKVVHGRYGWSGWTIKK